MLKGEYVQGNPFFGATVGRAAGRISGKGGSTADGSFKLAPSDYPPINPTGRVEDGFGLRLGLGCRGAEMQWQGGLTVQWCSFFFPMAAVFLQW